MKTLPVWLCLALVACSAQQTAPVESLTIAAGKPGSVYYQLGSALAAEAHRQWAVPSEVLSTTESIENLRLVAEGKADAGFTTLDVCAMALQGDAPFRVGLPLAALAGIYEDYLHIVVRADGDIRTIKELKGRRVSTGPPNSGTGLVANRVLHVVAMSVFDFENKELSAAEAAKALWAGEIDAFFVLGGLPTPAVADLAAHVPIRVLSLPDEVRKLREKYVDHYLARSIPVGLYGLDAPVVTIGIPNALVVRADMPEYTAYRLTQLLFAAKPQLAVAHREAGRLDPRSAIATFAVPLHQGAIRFYRESKPMVDTG